MEVLNEASAVLSNYEVLNILKEIKPRQKQGFGNQLATISYQTIKYLEETPCKDESSEKITNFVKALQQSKLTKSEKLMLVNLRPKTALEIQLIVEDSEDRLSEEEVESLLQLIADHFDEPNDEEEAVEEEEEEGA